MKNCGGDFSSSVASWITDAELATRGLVSRLANPSLSHDTTLIAVEGMAWESLTTDNRRVISVVDRSSGTILLETPGLRDTAPCWSPVSQNLAYLSEADGASVLCIWGIGEKRCVALPGTGCDAQWSPDGLTILVIVEGKQARDQLSDRFAVLVDAASGDISTPSGWPTAIWEAAWADAASVVCIASDHHDPDEWYSAMLIRCPVDGSSTAVLHDDTLQLGTPVPSPSGRYTAFIRALCSDRGVPAGDLVVIGCDASDMRPMGTDDVDVSCMQWRDEETLAFIGLRGLETVAGTVHVPTGVATTWWRSRDTCGVEYPFAAFTETGFIAVLEGYTRYPELCEVDQEGERVLLSVTPDSARQRTADLSAPEFICWPGEGGVSIEGILVSPPSDGPHPLVINLHGGPAWAWRNRWGMANGNRYPFVNMLVEHGFAVLHPNPRGSQGRGRNFEAAVIGDLGGVDARDIIAGISHLSESGRILPSRIATTGISYGGYLANWLPTLDHRISAAVAVAAPTDWISLHFSSDISTVNDMYFGSPPSEATALYCDRSPTLRATRSRAAHLNVAGRYDTGVPLGQAEEMHRALQMAGRATKLQVFPRQGHGIDGFPDTVNHLAALLEWLYAHTRNQADQRPAPLTREEKRDSPWNH